MTTICCRVTLSDPLVTGYSALVMMTVVELMGLRMYHIGSDQRESRSAA